MINFEEELKKFHPSLEIEDAEEQFGRDLKIAENDILVQKFNKEVVKKINLNQFQKKG